MPFQIFYIKIMDSQQTLTLTHIGSQNEVSIHPTQQQRTVQIRVVRDFKRVDQSVSASDSPKGNQQQQIQLPSKVTRYLDRIHQANNASKS
ncbi:hypothetical protein FGO68_gene10077 [Halteria grandinella]|uniref:Uncharacterized protein n=1 Tax=Halteria grandinella TaxID=5974 RepID=A0A8J8T506_HALGN|nr:hypothetical protein FGO68_gene10077 [Halteria grandinella]